MPYCLLVNLYSAAECKRKWMLFFEKKIDLYLLWLTTHSLISDFETKKLTCPYPHHPSSASNHKHNITVLTSHTSGNAIKYDFLSLFYRNIFRRYVKFFHSFKLRFEITKPRFGINKTNFRWGTQKLALHSSESSWN